jgi:hypothetical protein
MSLRGGAVPPKQSPRQWDYFKEWEIASSRRTLLATTVLVVKGKKKKSGCLRTPRLVGTKHGIQNYKQLTHTSGESHFFLLAMLNKPLIERSDKRIMFLSRQSRHV